MLHWGVQLELSVSLVDPVRAECYMVDQGRTECYISESRQKLSTTPIKLGVLCAVVRAWVSFVTHRCVGVRAWENVIPGRVEAVLDINEVRQN